MNDKSDRFIVAVMVVIIKEGKLLMMKRSEEKKAAPGLWETLSGRLQHGEGPREGLLREIKEESGLEVDLKPSPYDLYMTRYLGEPMLGLVYEANYLSGEVALSIEHSEYKWGTISDFEEKTILKRLLKSVKKLSTKIDL